jgi:hypothetical protein
VPSKWYLFNDEDVSRTYQPFIKCYNSEDFCGSTPYVLIYVRTDSISKNFGDTSSHSSKYILDK